jgi:hypothetical protein
MLEQISARLRAMVSVMATAYTHKKEVYGERLAAGAPGSKVPRIRRHYLRASHIAALHPLLPHCSSFMWLTDEHLQQGRKGDMISGQHDKKQEMWGCAAAACMRNAC